jgi:hypothetical protein
LGLKNDQNACLLVISTRLPFPRYLYILPQHWRNRQQDRAGISSRHVTPFLHHCVR